MTSSQKTLLKFLLGELEQRGEFPAVEYSHYSAEKKMTGQNQNNLNSNFNGFSVERKWYSWEEESRINISQRERAPMGGEIGKFSL